MLRFYTKKTRNCIRVIGQDTIGEVKFMYDGLFEVLPRNCKLATKETAIILLLFPLAIRDFQ